MTPEEIQEANAAISTHAVLEPVDGLAIRSISVPSVVIVLPLAHAEALSMCANVGLEGAPDRVVGDLTWAAVSKLDEVVREAKAVETADDVVERPLGFQGSADPTASVSREIRERAAANDDPRGERDR